MQVKRSPIPTLSAEGGAAWQQYEQHLREEVELSPSTIRNYLSDLRQFMAWCENTWSAGQEGFQPFAPDLVAPPTLTAYRTYLQTTCQARPASVNRALITLKRYFEWAKDENLVARSPAKAIRLVGQENSPPRAISDQEEAALVAAVEKYGDLRDRTIIILMLHTGLRAGEVCALKRSDVTLGKRSGTLKIWGKRNKYREVPLNSTARAALTDYFDHPDQANPTAEFIFLSQKTRDGLTVRALGYLIEKYATIARLEKISPHDLRHRFGYRMAERVPLHRLAQIMGHDSVDTTLLYVRGTAQDLQKAVENIAWE